MESKAFKINFKDEQGKENEVLINAASIEHAKSKLVSDYKVKEIIKIMDLPTASQMKHTINNPKIA